MIFYLPEIYIGCSRIMFSACIPYLLLCPCIAILGQLDTEKDMKMLTDKNEAACYIFVD